MKNIFQVSQFEFPYKYKFPGQASDELILFVTRENKHMLLMRRIMVSSSALAVLVVGWWLASMLAGFGEGLSSLVIMLAVVMAGIFGIAGWWWVSTLWRKSLCIVTTKRLIKFIYTTPFNRHNLSLPLEMIVDTGSYSKGFVQALFKLGTFTARSAAASSGVATDDEGGMSGGRVNKKYFYIEHITHAEDLQHYIAKLLEAHRHQRERLSTFRPFIPKLKGDRRKEFMEQWPEYWS